MTHHIAQLNVGYTLEPLDSERLKPFMDALDPINRRADDAPGFVWRLVGEEGNNATDVGSTVDDELIVNMSVWESIDELRDFVYRDRDHLAMMRRRREFFVHLEEAIQVLWWVPAGHIPTVAEAEARLAHLKAHGPTPHAFTFQVRFPPPGSDGEATPRVVQEDACPA